MGEGRGRREQQELQKMRFQDPQKAGNRFLGEKTMWDGENLDNLIQSDRANNTLHTTS